MTCKTGKACWSRTKCLAVTLRPCDPQQLGLEISESVALQGSSRGHWGLIAVWPLCFVNLKSLCVWQRSFASSQFTRFRQQGSHANCPQKTLVKGRSACLKTVLWTNWSLHLRAIVCTTIVDKSRPSIPCKRLVGLLSCRSVPDLPVAIIVEFAAIFRWGSMAHFLLSAARVLSNSPFCNVGDCCCQIFAFTALLQISRKNQHVDVGLTTIGDKLCVKVVD